MCHPCDEVLGLVARVPLKTEFLTFKSLTYPKCHNLTALRVTLQHSVLDPFPLLGGGGRTMKNDKKQNLQFPSSLLSWRFTEVHVNAEMP